jgi:capsule polysaccharide export protein KpsE/RkpR
VNTNDEQHQQLSDHNSDAMVEHTIQVATALLQRRGWLLKIALVGMLLALCIAFLIPNKFQSTVKLMPPDQQSISHSSALDGLIGSGGLISSAAGGSLLSGKTPGQVIIGIAQSRTVQDDIINRFDLRRVYHCKLYITARKVLADRSIFDEDKKSGIVSISIEDHDRIRARDIAGAYVDELDRLLIAVNTSSAHQERVFLEARLKSIKEDLDSASSRLSQYSSQNATLNPQSEGQMLIESAATIQNQLVAAQTELDALKTQYSDDNIRVRSFRARISELQSQLRKVNGIGHVGNSTLEANQLSPNIRELPLIGATYSDLSRQMILEQDIYQTLTKQYELAKVQEAKEIPTIKVLDGPDLAEVKSSPHRMQIVFLGTLLSFFLGATWVIARTIWSITLENHPSKIFVRKLMLALHRGAS